MADTDRGKREQVIALSKHTSKTHREIASDLGMCHSTVTRIINHYHQTGSVKTLRKGKCGPKPKVGKTCSRYLVRESVKDPRKTAREIHLSSGQSAPNVCLRTIQRILKKGGRQCFRPRKVHKLDQSKKQRRWDWAKRHVHMNQELWNMVS
jgi:IS30 family transposase